MGHSIQVYGDRSAIINDFQVIVLLVYALREIALTPKSETLQNLERAWRHSLESSGVGCYDLKLDELVRSPEDRQNVYALLEAVVNELSQYGDLIPAEVLNEQMKQAGVTGVRFYDFKFAFVVETVGKLLGLLKEKQ